MKLVDALDGHLRLLARWLDRSETLMAALVTADGSVLSVSRGYMRRSGCTNRLSDLRLSELLHIDGVLLLNPPYGAPVHQRATCPGDCSSWLISVFETEDGSRLLVGSLESASPDIADRHEDILTSELFAYQRHLNRGNRHLRLACEEAERELAVDTLTGVASRWALQTRAAEVVAEAERTGAPLSIILCDIDRFKSVNDTHGHAAGDAVLKAFGAVLKANCRGTDLPARPGGEEFTVLTPGADLAHAMALAERLRAAVEARVVPAIGRAVTASFGVAQWIPGESLKDTEARGDAALYRAKEGGRNQVVCAEEPRLPLAVAD
jgi:diguanylate cyclase (GGDEF)-like protein